MIKTKTTIIAGALATAAIAIGGLSPAQGDTSALGGGEESALSAPIVDTAVPGSESVASVSAPDPNGGPPWRIRTHRTQEGRMCYTAGRVVGGRFGQTGRGGGFAEAPLDGGAVCGKLTPPIDFSVSTGGPAPGSSDSALTIVTGIASGDVKEVRVSALGDSVSQVPAANGAFIATFRGEVDEHSLPLVTATMDDGSQQTFRIDQ